jgi:1-acyl-sn-glycerol-3-phosphate acyltransferase
VSGRSALIEGIESDLDARDPEFIRAQLPGMWLLASIYFRAEINGLDRIPDEGPVLFVGNHSGGNMTPDTIVFLLAFNTYFGVERPVHALAHALVTSWPGLGGFLKRWGVVTAGREVSRAVLEGGKCVLVYPGGDVETHRPWTARNEIRFDGRKGFIQLARETGVPIVPVVASGGHDTYLPLTDGRRIASALRLDKIARLKVLPISLALPWGVNIGDFLGHFPLPAKIRMEVLEPIDVAASFGDDDEAAYGYITDLMQETLVALSASDVLGPVV